MVMDPMMHSKKKRLSFGKTRSLLDLKPKHFITEFLGKLSIHQKMCIALQYDVVILSPTWCIFFFDGSHFVGLY